MIKLALYVRGRGDDSLRAIENVREACSCLCGETIELDLVDLDEQPHAAERDGVLVTPMLVWRTPPQGRKVIGDLCDRSSIVAAIGQVSSRTALDGLDASRNAAVTVEQSQRR